MNTSRSRIRYVIFLLPVVAVAMIMWQYTAQIPPQETSIRHARLTHLPALGRGPLHGEAIYRLATNGGTPPPAAFQASAPQVFDGAVGDCSTGYAAAEDSVTSSTKGLCVLIDLGVEAPAVQAWEFACEFRGGTANSVTLLANDSPFAAEWTRIDALNDAKDGKISATRSIAAARHRYWLIQYESDGAAASVRASDARLMDHDGHAIGSRAGLSEAERLAIERRDFALKMSPLRYSGQ